MSGQANGAGVAPALRDSLHRWFDGFPGRHLFELDRLHLQQVLPNLFGYHLLQIGCVGDADLLEGSRIQHKVVARLEDDSGSGSGAGLVCAAETLPVAADSLDVVVLPHVLEFSSNPHRVLREVERVLIGEGHVVLIGFNPWSLWGLWRLCLGWREEPPWCGHFYDLSRIRDWLSLLDFELVETRRYCYRPPLRSQRLMQRLRHLELLGRHLWPWFAGVYLLVAKKRVIPLTPLKMRWRTRRSMIAAGAAEPSARGSALAP